MSDALRDRLASALADRYRIERELGEGGMATVYLATDLKHNRSVALKVLKPELAAVVGAERFLAEIETTANLTHPHLLPLHDSGNADGFLFYVMPYVEGESLRERLDRERQLAVDEAVRIATAVAGALDHAHRHSVVHRDIKPANILLQDGQPVVADFGIALAVGAAEGTRLTETGLSVGTPYYMSPEQATGDTAVGPRADIYALSCVTYQMLVGDPPYVGSTAQAVLGKIIAGRLVPPAEARPSVPPNVDAAVRKGLEKLPADRFESAAAFASALADPTFRHGTAAVADPGVIRRLKRRSHAFAAAAGVMAVVAAWALFAPEDAPEPELLRVTLEMPEDQAIVPGPFDISDDGRLFVYTGPGPESDSRQLYLRRADALTATVIPGTEFARGPEISPDGSELALITEEDELRVVPLSGGVPRIVADSVIGGLAWTPDGSALLFIPWSGGGLMRVAAGGGGTPERVTHADSAVRHTDPDVLPDGRHVLVTVFGRGEESVGVADLETGEVRTLFPGGHARFSPSGHILYEVHGDPNTVLMAVPFDMDALELRGEPVPIEAGVGSEVQDVGGVSVSHTGRLLIGLRTEEVDPDRVTPVWIDREGGVDVVDPSWTFDPGGNNRGIEISPDGSRVAVNRFEDRDWDIWVKQLPRGAFSPVTREPFEDVRPKWTEDGRILYISSRGEPGAEDEQADVWIRRADGLGEPELVLDYESEVWEVEVAPGGEWLAARVGGLVGEVGARDVVVRGPDDEEPRPVMASDFDEKAIALSPDGRWLAYESDASGRNEVYVRPFPNVDDGRFPVSQQGGVMPKWAHRTNELYFVNGSREMVAATFETEGEAFRVTDLQVLFELPEDVFFPTNENYALYDVDVDDQRFIWMRRLEGEIPWQVVLLDDWTAALGEGGG